MNFDKLKFVGWIPGKPKDRRTLRQLGVRGTMFYNPRETAFGTGYFSYCEATEEVMERLILEFHLPNPESFIAIDKDEGQLYWENARGTSQPYEQRYWHERWNQVHINSLKDRISDLEDSK